MEIRLFQSFHIKMLNSDNKNKPNNLSSTKTEKTNHLPKAYSLLSITAAPTPHRAELIRLSGTGNGCFSTEPVGLLQVLECVDLCCSSSCGPFWGWRWNLRVIMTRLLSSSAMHVERFSENSIKCYQFIVFIIMCTGCAHKKVGWDVLDHEMSQFMKLR